MPGDAQEGFDAVERAMPDREVLLHDPSTLSRIVARRKWPYFFRNWNTKGKWQ
jgi:hypothetical protein